MLPTTSEIVRACEAAEAGHLAAQMRAVRQLAPELDPLAFEVAGGIAALTVPDFGRKLNHVSGAGMGEPVTMAQLEQLEDAYRARGVPLELDLCPHSHAESLANVARAGYSVNAYANTYWQDLGSSGLPLVAATSGFEVRELRGGGAAGFVEASARGFASQPRPRALSLLTMLAQSACSRADTKLFTATLDGQLAATAALAMLETSAGQVALLYLSSTLPEFRGRGAQAALIARRMQAAREAGARIAMLTARPTTGSARNAERCGFQLAFTKPTFCAARDGA